jgi:hypothetical protein
LVWLEYRAFTDELRAGEHEQRTTSMTALQDWLSNRPVDPRNLKDLIRDAIRGLTPDSADDEADAVKDAELTLMGRGLERC